MSSVTKKQRRDDIVTMSGQYDVELKLQPGQIDQAADFGRDAIFWEFFDQYKHVFREKAQFSHGDNWPQRFMALAKRQYLVDGGNTYPIRLAHVSELAQFQRNTRILGTATDPVLYLADRKFYFEPPTVAGAFIEYFKYPARLSEPDVLDTATDTMPAALEPLITRAGFERALKMQVDDADALKLTQDEYQKSIATLEQLFNEKFAEQTKNPLKEDQT